MIEVLNQGLEGTCFRTCLLLLSFLDCILLFYVGASLILILLFLFVIFPVVVELSNVGQKTMGLIEKNCRISSLNYSSFFHEYYVITALEILHPMGHKDDSLVLQ